MNILLIARHGNTFDKGDVVLRVGRRTDIPLSHSGIAQAERLRAYLETRHPDLGAVYSGRLRRAAMTAHIAAGRFEPLPELDEVDYGEDDGKPESEVAARIGAEALARWETENVPPPGWHVDAQGLKEAWRALVRKAFAGGEGRTVLCVTSNGVARFAPLALCPALSQGMALKLAPGAVGRIDLAPGGEARPVYWNEVP